MQPFLQQVYEWLSRYLSGAISLVEFQEWFAPTAWDVMDTEDDVVSVQLACSIELVLAEFANGHWTEDELKERLQEHTRPAPLMINVSDAITLTTGWTIRVSSPQTTTTATQRITTPRSTVTPDYQRTKPQTSQVSTAA